MKGYWVVAVQDVIKPDTWEQVLSSWGNYVEKSNGVVNPISFGPPKAVYESGVEKTTAVIEFPSLDQAVHARIEDPDYYRGVIEADGRQLELLLDSSLDPQFLRELPVQVMGTQLQQLFFQPLINKLT